ncbi:uncharacterized protein QC763_0087240 [Podospora pseudopauciseta]|uniref:Uncharacterized protein n=1 Tax=Podospora pseudopauciseta TaxID=2093780 RepID=A0ABR0H9H7_9PEZI|nr:hypothetical protein QC763_0087240 [Podospora pseudopauciseta]
MRGCRSTCNISFPIFSPQQLENQHVYRTVLVIGANGGIGFQLATRFLKEGYKVFGTYRPQTKDDVSVAEMRWGRPQATALLFLILKLRQLDETGVQSIELDYANEESTTAAAKGFAGEKLDILINCGAIYNT